MGGRGLRFLAGPGALETIRRDGFDPARVRVVPGASGGPKWLVLGRLDRVLLPRLLAGRSAPLFLLGSSIGAWRFACWAQDDPAAALDRLEASYLAWRHGPGDRAPEITRGTRAMLDRLLGPDGARQVLSHPVLRLSVMAVRGRGLLASDRPAAMMPGFAAAALANAVSRRALGLFFDRALFADPRSRPPFAGLDGFPRLDVPLSQANLAPALMATAAIPAVIDGVRDIAGAPPGTYRDGGIIDYHFDVPFLGARDDGLVLYPHFIDRVVPGWFDKKLAWRRAAAAHLDRVLLLAPDPDWVARLPHAKIPERTDFNRFDNDTRIAAWRRVVAEAERLADDFLEAVDGGTLPDRLEPLV